MPLRAPGGMDTGIGNGDTGCGHCHAIAHAATSSVQDPYNAWREAAAGMTATGGSPSTTTLASTCSPSPSGSFVKSRRLSAAEYTHGGGVTDEIHRITLARFAKQQAPQPFASLVYLRLGAANRASQEPRDLAVLVSNDVVHQEKFFVTGRQSADRAHEVQPVDRTFHRSVAGTVFKWTFAI